MTVPMTLMDQWHGYGGPVMWWWPLTTVLLFAAIVAAGIYLARRRPGFSGGPQAPEAGAEQVLAERFARGDISEEEYAARLDVLRRNKRR